jgi:hypothetical protein
MKAIKRYMALAAVLLFIMAGCILLMIDCDTVRATWMNVGGAFICIGIGLVLTHVFKNKNLLPE